jgi:NAD(P)H-hydrate epimerase
VTLPGWLDPLFDAGEMRASDRWAIEEQGVPSIDLMERAGTGLARLTAEVAGEGPVRVVVGKGNNGGDGLVVARLLRDEGREVDVLAVGDLSELKGDPRVNLERLPGAAPEAFEPARLAGSGAIVDAIFGTGFEGEPREPARSAIAAINEASGPVVACDVPSGVNASNGEVAGEAVRAAATGTFHGSKIGLHVAPGAYHSGEVRVIEIGTPRGGPGASTAGLVSDGVLDLIPHRERDGTKFTSGVVAVAGGSRGLTGAPTMVALAAARAGAGYVQVAIPESVETVVELRLLEQMTRGLPDRDGAHVPEGVEHVKELAERAGAVALGPGLGRTDGAVAFARGVAREIDVPVVIDADGLNAHAGEIEALRERPAPTVITPHAGELGRLMDVPSQEVDAHRLVFARDAAERSGTVVVLKGDDSLVVEPGGLVAVSPGASPALATAGTGDVLSGVIAAFLAKGLGAFEAAAAGVHAHARAGQEAARRLGADHTMAGDVIDALPAALFGP